MINIDLKNIEIMPLGISASDGGGSSGVEIKNQSKSIEITENGTQTVTYSNGYTGLEKVTIITNVDIPTFETQTKIVDITENGDYVLTPNEGYDGIESVEVNVNVDIPSFTVQTKTIEITENGTQTISVDEGYDGIDSIEITTNVECEGGSSGDNPFSVIGYTSTPQYIQDNIDYAQTIYDNWGEDTNLRSVFQNDKKIVYLPKIDTSNVTNMEYGFYGCINIELIPSLNTSNVTNMQGMFGGCRSLISLDLSSFDTSNVTSMQRMFENCIKLQSLDLSSFDTANVKYISYMFNNCSGLISLDLSSFDTSNVTNMESMFYNCSGLASLNLSGWDTSNVTNMRGMFGECRSLISLDLSSFDTVNVTNMESMFYNCSGLTKVDGYISFKSYSSSTMSYSYLWGYSKQNNLRKITFKDIGYHSDAIQFNMSYATVWGVNNDTITDARQSLIDSLITYSFDRAAAGYSTFTVTLAADTKAVLTEDEIAQITAKGFTIA